MRLKKTMAAILVVAAVLTLGGCKSRDKEALNTSLKDSEKNSAVNNLLKTPDKINMNADGKQKQLSKSGDAFEQTLFDRIKFLIDVRLPSELSVMQGAYSDNDIKEVKSFSVEFIYDKPQTITINNGNKTEIEFTSIYFPLGTKWQNTAFIKTKSNYYTPVGIKENLDYLIKASVKL